MDAEDEGFDFVAKCEHLFLRNIYSSDELEQMDIETEKRYTDRLYRVFEFYSKIEAVPVQEEGDVSDEMLSSSREDLDDSYPTPIELKDDIRHVSIPPPPKKISSKRKWFSEKMLAFLYLSMVRFVLTDKIKGIPVSKNFIDNLRGIMSNKTHIHHSHIADEILGVRT